MRVLRRIPTDAIFEGTGLHLDPVALVFVSLLCFFLVLLYVLYRARTRAELRLEGVRLDWQALWAHLPLGAYLANDEGALLAMNPALGRMLELPAALVEAGTPRLNLTRFRNLDRWGPALTEPDAVYESREQWTTAAGNRAPFSERAFRLSARGGSYPCIVGIVADERPIQQLTSERDRLRVQLSRTLRDLAGVRTDLEATQRTILSYLAMAGREQQHVAGGLQDLIAGLERTTLSDEQQTFVGSLAALGQTLARSNQTFIDLFDAESTAAQPGRETFDLGACLEAGIERLAGAAAAKQVVLSYRLGEGVPRRVESDRNRLVLVVYLLLRAVLRKAAGGNVEFEVQVVERNGSACTLEAVVVVEDELDAALHTMRRPSEGDEAYDFTLIKRLLVPLDGVLCPVLEKGDAPTLFFTVRTPSRNEPPPSESIHSRQLEGH